MEISKKRLEELEAIESAMKVLTDIQAHKNKMEDLVTKCVDDIVDELGCCIGYPAGPEAGGGFEGDYESHIKAILETFILDYEKQNEA